MYENCHLGIGGIYTFIVPELNDIYSGIKYKQPWKQKVIEMVLPHKNDYLKCIKRLVDWNFSENLLTSFVYNQPLGWYKNKNQELFEEMKKLGVRH
ncbi:hypothetical protein [Williamsoniiplasma lucivorax]|uniref:hypothetical protein n=1 Tax=Williamsoniiplasma lucivorax TaxID=209274 RepID=UPI0011B0DDB8|nr:hypothetical protein [Williamsoniiplasma lucivorax]